MLGRGEIWPELIIDEECVTLLLDTIVDIWDSLSELANGFFEIIVGHSDRLFLELGHDCLIDQRQ